MDVMLFERREGIHYGAHRCPECDRKEIEGGKIGLNPF